MKCFRMKLTALHRNGATTMRAMTFSVRTGGGPDVNALQAGWGIAQAVQTVVRRQPEARQFLTDELIAAAPTPPAKLKLKVLRGIVEPPTPVHPATVTEPQDLIFGVVMELAARHQLSSYDASYLELPIRLKLPLSTLDELLQRTAVAERVELVTTI